MELTKREIEGIWDLLRTRLECGPREHFRERLQQWIADGELSLEGKSGALEIKTPAGLTLRIQRSTERGSQRRPAPRARR